MSKSAWGSGQVNNSATDSTLPRVCKSVGEPTSSKIKFSSKRSQYFHSLLHLKWPRFLQRSLTENPRNNGHSLHSHQLIKPLTSRGMLSKGKNCLLRMHSAQNQKLKSLVPTTELLTASNIRKNLLNFWGIHSNPRKCLGCKREPNTQESARHPNQFHQQKPHFHCRKITRPLSWNRSDGPIK